MLTSGREVRQRRAAGRACQRAHGALHVWSGPHIPPPSNPARCKTHVWGTRCTTSATVAMARVRAGREERPAPLAAGEGGQARGEGMVTVLANSKIGTNPCSLFLGILLRGRKL